MSWDKSVRENGAGIFRNEVGRGGVNWAKSVRKRERVGDGGITHKHLSQNPSYPLPPTVGIRQSADGAESEGKRHTPTRAYRAKTAI